MWIYRPLLKIPWTATVTNEMVLNSIGTKRSLLQNIRRRQIRIFDHIHRQNTIKKLAVC